MAVAIRPKRSETASSVPSASDLAVGEIAVNISDQKIYTKNSGGTVVEIGSGGGSGSGESVSWSVTQSSHGFSVGDVLYYSSGSYAKAQADAAATLGLFIVSAVANTNTFTATLSGKISGLSSLTAGQYYFLSASTAGLLTTTEPTTGYSNPIFFALSTTEGVVLPFRPAQIDTTLTTIAVADGGTGATSAAAARTNLEVLSTSEVNAQALLFGIVMG